MVHMKNTFARKHKHTHNIHLQKSVTGKRNALCSFGRNANDKALCRSVPKIVCQSQKSLQYAGKLRIYICLRMMTYYQIDTIASVVTFTSAISKYLYNIQEYSKITSGRNYNYKSGRSIKLFQ